MTAQALDWLPPEAALQPAVCKRVGEAVGEWSAAWFSQEHFAAPTFTAVGVGSTPASEEAWRRYGQAVSVQTSSRARDRLLGWALDIRLEEEFLSDTDRDVLDAFERRLIGDLVARVEQALEIIAATNPYQAEAAPFGRLGGMAVGLGDSRGGNLITLAVPLSAFLRLCRASLPPHRRSSDRMGDFTAAVGPTPVRLSLILGGAELELAELRGLAAGDVVVLDRGAADPLELTLAETNRPVLRGLLGDNHGRLAVTLAD